MTVGEDKILYNKYVFFKIFIVPINKENVELLNKVEKVIDGKTNNPVLRFDSKLLTEK